MAHETVASLQTVAPSSEGVRVDFYKEEDRFGHTIFLIGSDQSQPLLGSTEGSDNEDAPPSPPLAELHQQDELLFLTGATSLAHWSMSVEVVANRLVFDVACRWREESCSLGSEYHVLDERFQEAIDIEFMRAARAELTDGTLQIEPTTLPTETFPATVQWQYAIERKSD